MWLDLIADEIISGGHFLGGGGSLVRNLPTEQSAFYLICILPFLQRAQDGSSIFAGCRAEKQLSIV